MILSIEEISRARNIAKRNLKQFDFFDEKQHKIRAENMETFLSLDYRTSQGNPAGTTHFDLNIYNNSNGKICYLAEIELLKSLRGKGHGKKLYKIVEDIGRDLGCNWVVMHPSGWTFDKKRRREYMETLGYKSLNEIEVGKLL